MPIHHQGFSALDLDFKLEVSLPTDIQVGVEVSQQKDLAVPDTTYLKIKVTQKLPVATSLTPVKGELKLTWSVPVIDMHGLITFPPTQADMGTLPPNQGEKRTWTGSSLPLFMLYHRNGNNRFSFGLLDQLTETKLVYALDIIAGNYQFTLTKPFIWQNGSWRETIQLSTYAHSWQAALASYREFVDREWPQPRLPVPEQAYGPVFCTWYGTLHEINQDWVIENAYVASRMGFKTWITDDGWFLDKVSASGSGEFAGDWQPSEQRFPEFKDHVEMVQKMGMRYLLWVAPTMVGKYSQAAKDYPQLLQQPENAPFFSLTPWKAQTGEIITQNLERLLKDYRLDGFKLDFIDSIDPKLVPTDPDYATAGEGLYTILSQVLERLQAINPELLIEFRNSYANLANRRFANLYRANDTPYNLTANRWQVAIERLLAPDRAVVSDPVVWGPDASLEDVAVSLINAICCVPMVSINLSECQVNHENLIRNWIKFYNTHLKTIMHGEFVPEFHGNSLPLIRFNGEKEQIIGLYEDYPVSFKLKQSSKIFILNASSQPYVDILPGTGRIQLPVITYDKFGESLSWKFTTFPVNRLGVEVGGSLEIGHNLVESPTSVDQLPVEKKKKKKES